MKKFLTLMLCTFLVISLLAACGSTKEATTETKKEATKDQGKDATTENKTETKTEPTTEATNDQPKPGGKVTYGYGQPFKGLLESAFWQGQDDGLIISVIDDSLFKTGDDLKNYPNIASWTESPDHKTFKFTIKQGVKWHNGDELTVEDWKFALEVIAHKDYTGPRYSNVEMIQGAKEYHEGKAKEISGIKVIDPYNIEITVNKAAVNTLDNLWSSPMNKKYYEGVPVAKMDSSDQVRKNPIGLGPFKVKKIQPGEFVELERFDDYWQGKPYLDTIVYKVIDDKLATSLLEKGEIDYMSLPNSQYKEAEKLKNISLTKNDSLSYSYIGFSLGHWDKKQEKVVMDKPKFADKRLRQAMYYAIDVPGMIDAFSNGLGTPIYAPMPTVSWAKIPDDQITKYAYDPEKAKQLLDEAGYKDVDGDGFREDPKGKKFTINFDAMQGSEIAEPRAQYILQMWKDVGLNAKLNGGALKEFNLFYDTIQNDDPSVETFMGAWGLASDPDPSGLWTEKDAWNFPRWVNAASDKLIADGIGEKAFDPEQRKQIYFEWQKLVNEEVPMIFLSAPQDVAAINNRLKGVHLNSFSSSNLLDAHLWWVTDGK
ncbi:oligopeptide ABC transporter substrate-binding protein [Paenibacillus terrigena]|uniref:oligopeptide ABC transporter substrate-binding protein n=1 Tax=Paenibacillus terrigena TaxID=369333 RepID=UPI00035FB6FA|nr:oligopeptide ABC transporter substrate-binding protein [Paenibacillus terrigena]